MKQDPIHHHHTFESHYDIFNHHLDKGDISPTNPPNSHLEGVAKICINFKLTFDWHKNVHFERHKAVALKNYDLLSNSISRFLKYLENMCSFTFE
jgi:hypothetical protein